MGLSLKSHLLSGRPHFLFFTFLHCAQRLHEVGTALNLLQNCLSDRA